VVIWGGNNLKMGVITGNNLPKKLLLAHSSKPFSRKVANKFCPMNSRGEHGDRQLSNSMAAIEAEPG
jgi:hypothetical protein